MKNLFRTLIMMISVCMVYFMINKDAPDILKRTGLPTVEEVQKMVTKTIDETIATKTVELGEDQVRTLFYIGNNTTHSSDGEQLLETEVINRKWGKFGIEIEIRSLLENNDSSIPNKDRTTRIDSSGRRAKVLMYEVKDRRRISVDNSWIMIDRGDCYSYIAEVRLVNGVSETSMLIELLMEKGATKHPLLGVKLLKVRPPTKGDMKLFVFDDKRSFAYEGTIFKAIRAGVEY